MPAAKVGYCGIKWDNTPEIIGALILESGTLPSLDSFLTQGDSASDFRSSSSFFGSYTHQLDAKGRVSLPASFRTKLEALPEKSLVLTNYLCDGARCLEAFPIQTWQIFENRLRDLSRFDSKLKTLENFYFSRAALSSPDSSGRISVPTHLRTYAGLKDNVCFTAGLRGFRVWDQKVWDHVFSKVETALLNDPDLFKNIDKAMSSAATKNQNE